MSYSQVAIADVMRSALAANINAAYAAVGTPFLHYIRIMYMDNLTNQNVVISFDGINDNFILPPSGFKTVDFTANEVSSYKGFFPPVNLQVYAKYTSVQPTTGSLYIQAIFGNPLPGGYNQ